MNAPQRPPLLFRAAEARLQTLDELPRGLWLWSLIHSQGRLEPRLAGVEALRQNLYAGTLAEPPQWPAPLSDELAAVLRQLDLPGYCEGKDDLTEAVLRSLMWHLDLIVDYRDRGDSEQEARQRALDAFAAEWQDRCGTVDELTAVFGNCGDLLKNSRWDLLHGLLRSVGWQEVTRIRQLLEKLPDLADLIRRLGRAQNAEGQDDLPRQPVEVMEKVWLNRALSRPVRVPEYPGETTGTRRSGRIARMLPAEAMLLAHPKLRLIWHARHAERALLTYEDQDVMPEPAFEQLPSWQPKPRPEPDQRLEMGPMIVCVDTSGSMQGGAEAVAKAVVLEAVRTAHAQRRPCHVFAFSGPEEVIGLEIGVDEAGLQRLTQFMGQSFQGGTDICDPLARALDLVEEGRWSLADLLIASDGEFGATPEMALRVEEAKTRLGLRIQGILIGDRETVGFMELADHIHWVHDWRRYGPTDVELRVRTKSLTATYFPGALRNPETRAGTVDGETAAKAVRAGLHRGESL